MTHKERFYATIERRDVDRPASWLGLPTTEATQHLIEYFHVESLQDVLNRLDDDLSPVELPYHSPTSDAIYMAFDFALQGHNLIDLGVDAIHPIQALAKDMSVEKMKTDFYGKVAFCGGVDAQELIVNGTPEQVYQRVQELKRLFPTGLIISPSHEAILPDVDPANMEAIFAAIAQS